MLRIDTFTEKGGYHSTNEDYLLEQLHSSGGQNFLCFMADGQGGRPDGAAAAKRACEGARDAAMDRTWADLALASTWDEIFSVADRFVQHTCNGFTTLIGFAVSSESITGASVGDSKVYFHDGENEFIELTQGQDKNPAVGGGCRRATIFCVPALRGTILAVTDGVWKYVGYDLLRDVASLRDLKQIPVSLREAVVAGQGGSLPDDFTVLIASNIEQLTTGTNPNPSGA